MGLIDKLLGRGKRAAGEAMNSPGLREEGRHQETAGHAADAATGHEEQAQEMRERAAEERTEQERSNL